MFEATRLLWVHFLSCTSLTQQAVPLSLA